MRKTTPVIINFYVLLYIQQVSLQVNMGFIKNQACMRKVFFSEENFLSTLLLFLGLLALLAS